jgi:hypothetical protein
VQPDGSALCWYLVSTPNPSAVPDIPMGSYRMISGVPDGCGVKTDGSVVCWGRFGEALDWTPAPAGPFSEVSVDRGALTRCMLAADRVVCEFWGMPTQSQVIHAGSYRAVAQQEPGYCLLAADGSVSCYFRGTPETSPSGSFAGIDRSCGILAADGTLSCWDSGIKYVPTGSFSSLSLDPGADANYGCGISDDGRVVCWSMAGHAPLCHFAGDLFCMR